MFPHVPIPREVDHFFFLFLCNCFKNSKTIHPSVHISIHPPLGTHTAAVKSQNFFLFHLRRLVCFCFCFSVVFGCLGLEEAFFALLLLFITRVTEICVTRHMSHVFRFYQCIEPLFLLCWLLLAPVDDGMLMFMVRRHHRHSRVVSSFIFQCWLLLF